jgi:hypothetical protein
MGTKLFDSLHQYRGLVGTCVVTMTLDEFCTVNQSAWFRGSVCEYVDLYVTVRLTRSDGIHRIASSSVPIRSSVLTGLFIGGSWKRVWWRL